MFNIQFASLHACCFVFFSYQLLFSPDEKKTLNLNNSNIKDYNTHKLPIQCYNKIDIKFLYHNVFSILKKVRKKKREFY